MKNKNYNTPGLPVIDESIEDVNFFSFQYLKKHLSPITIFLLSLPLLFFLITVFVAWLAIISTSYILLIFAIPPFMIGLIPVALYFHTASHIRMLFMRQFAEANKFKFIDMKDYLLRDVTKKERIKIFNALDRKALNEKSKEIRNIMKQEKGRLFEGIPLREGVNLSDGAHNIVLGSFMEHPMRIFNYSQNITPRKKRFYTVLSVHFDKRLPHMYLDAADAENKKARGWAREDLEKISLESNEFDRKYDLYITGGQQIPALQIFTPDFMAHLIDLPEKYDIEFIEDRLYIYEPKLISTKNELENMFLLGKYLIDNLNHVLKSFKYEAKEV